MTTFVAVDGPAFAIGQHREGLAHAERALTIHRRLSTTDPGNKQNLRNVAFALQIIGDARAALRLDGAPTAPAEAKRILDSVGATP